MIAGESTNGFGAKQPWCSCWCWLAAAQALWIVSFQTDLDLNLKSDCDWVRQFHQSRFGSHSWESDNVAYTQFTLVPKTGTQFDLKQATGFEALSVIPMNTLLLIKEKELKSQRLHDAQRSFAARSEGIDYTSAHQSPTKLASRAS